VLPFITEELNSLVLDSLEKPHKFLVERAPLEGLISQEQIGFTASDEQMINRFFDILKEVRRVRASLDVPPREQCFMTVPSAQESGFARLIQLFKPFWEGLTHTSVGLAPDSLLYKTMTISIAEESVLIAVPQACLEKRLSRIKEDLQRCLTKINKSKERLSDPHFCSHAPETVRLKEEQRLAELLVEQQALQHSLSLLS
jgi:valyl-tRNA synthetase